VLGVSDVDRAKAFYEKLGWRSSSTGHILHVEHCRSAKGREVA
jgi:hypothetical protein